MTLLLTKEPTEAIPIKMSKDNVILVGGTRVTLDTVVDAFNSGSTPEEIVYQYPTLNLRDVYAVVGYYLNHRTEVTEYLLHRQRDAEKIRQENEKRLPSIGIRERLLARRTSYNENP